MSDSSPSKIKFEFEMDAEGAENILRLIMYKIAEMRFNAATGSYTSAEREWMMRAADAMEFDCNVMAAGSKKV